MAHMKKHWECIYDSREINQLGWYEETPKQSLELFDKCKLDKNELILDVGSGASLFVDNLINRGYRNIVATDISKTALEKLKGRLGKNASLVKWIVDDLTQPKHLQELKNVAVWHDRAVLHFLTKESERKTYLSTLLRAVKKGGYVIIAAFSLQGACKCSGLDVRRYDQNMLKKFLGDEFKLLQHFNYLYHMPSGNVRPYVYTLFQRK